MIVQQIKTFEVDDAIAPHIKLLNNKGYCTSYCCSGHKETSGLLPVSIGYVYFDAFAGSYFKQMRIKPPKYWEFDGENDSGEIGLYVKVKDIKEFEDLIIELSMKSLYEWIEKLPVIKLCNLINLEVVEVNDNRDIN